MYPRIQRTVSYGTVYSSELRGAASVCFEAHPVPARSERVVYLWNLTLLHSLYMYTVCTLPALSSENFNVAITSLAHRASGIDLRHHHQGMAGTESLPAVLLTALSLRVAALRNFGPLQTDGGIIKSTTFARDQLQTQIRLLN